MIIVVLAETDDFKLSITEDSWEMRFRYYVKDIRAVTHKSIPNSFEELIKNFDSYFVSLEASLKQFFHTSGRSTEDLYKNFRGVNNLLPAFLLADHKEEILENLDAYRIKIVKERTDV